MVEQILPDLKKARNRQKEETRIEYFDLDPKYQNLGKGKTYYIFTYGCQGNEADSEVLAGIFERMGYTLAPEAFKSDVVILNTCAIRAHAEDRIWGVLGQLKGAKRDKPDMIVGICGCMPQEENVSQRLIESYPHVDIIFGTHNIVNLPSMLERKYNLKKKVVEVLSTQGSIFEHTPKIRQSKHKAWVNIMYGCDEFCTYCIVPYTRGKERSRAKEDIIEEVNELVKNGYKEITLLGQNVNAYGKDKYEDYSFGDLLTDLDKTGIERIRYTTSHPRDFDDKTIEAHKLKSVMPYLHLPVQSGNNEVLKRINRKYTREEYLEKLRKLRIARPDISVTTDIIVAFPGETNEQYLDTLSLVEEAGFEGAYTFIFSPREGTPAYSYPDTLTPEEKSDRLNKLNEKVKVGYKKGHERFVGQEVKVLVDAKSKNGDNMLCGYTEHNKLCHFKSDDLSLIGQIVKVKVTEAYTWFMIGELCE